MVRIESACLMQSLIFDTQEELTAYRKKLERRKVPHRIISEENQPDGRVLVKVARQYTHYPTGGWLN